MTEPILAVAFDIDGTLYHPVELWHRLPPIVFPRVSFFLDFLNLRNGFRRENFVGNIRERQLELFATKRKITVEMAKKQLSEFLYDGFKPFFHKTRPFEHIREVISGLKKRGLKLAVLSDFPPSQKGDIWGTMPFYDVVLSSEECGALKPHPLPFRTLAEKLGVAAKNILYVGNNFKIDIMGAKSIGMQSAMIVPPIRRALGLYKRGADIVFSNYLQLEKEIEKRTSLV